MGVAGSLQAATRVRGGNLEIKKCRQDCRHFQYANCFKEFLARPQVEACMASSMEMPAIINPICSTLA